MEIDSANPASRSRRAAISLVALCLTTALGVGVGSYLALILHSRNLADRRLHLERAREIAQVGLEEALWALNQNNWTSAGPTSSTAWTVAGANRTVTLNYGSIGHGVSAQTVLTVTNFASTGPTWPSVTSEAILTLNDGRVVRKSLSATTGPAPLFGNAIASANAGVSFSARGLVDSWNSDPDNNPATAAVPYSFSAANPSNYAAVVAGRDDGAQGVALTQATVRGYVTTFGRPVAYSVSGSPPAQVKGPTTPASVDVDPARLGRSAFVPVAPVFTVKLPATSGPTYGGLISNILALVAALLGAAPSVEVYQTAGDFTILGIPLLSPSLTVSRPLKLIVNGNLNISGAGKITVTTTGSLQIFVLGDCTIGGGGIDNQNTAPEKLAIFCTNSSTTNTLEYTSSSDFNGVIYCENKPIDIRQNATFHGALLSSRQISFSAGATNPVFHYDTALRTKRFDHITTPYLITRLTEL